MKDFTFKCSCLFLLLFVVVSFADGQSNNQNKMPVRAFRSLLADKNSFLFSSEKAGHAINPFSSRMKIAPQEVIKYKMDSVVSDTYFGDGRSKWVYKYDNLGRIIYEDEYEFVDSIQKYRLLWGSRYLYKTMDTTLIKDTYYFDGDSSDISFSERKKTIYDRNGNVLSEKTGRDTIYFDSHAIEVVDYQYLNGRLLSKQTMEYGDFTKTDYYYDEFGRDTTEVSSTKLGAYGDYGIASKTVFKYDSRGDKVEINNSLYKLEQFNLSQSFKLGYNQSHNCVSYTCTFSNDTTKLHQIMLFKYDDLISRNDIYSGDIFDGFPISFQSQINEMSANMSVGDSLILCQKIVLYYSPVNKTTSAVEAAPASGKTMLRYNSRTANVELIGKTDNSTCYLRIYNSNGMLLLDKKITGSVCPVSLPQGVYIYKLSSPQSDVFTGKLIVK